MFTDHDQLFQLFRTSSSPFLAIFPAIWLIFIVDIPRHIEWSSSSPRILGLHFLDQSVQSDDIRVLHPQDDSGVSYKLRRNHEQVFFFFKGSNINSRCLDVHCQCSSRYSLALIPNVQMFRSWILDVQMFSLPAAWPPATSSRVWLWRGESSLQVIIVDIVVNIIVVIVYLSSLLSFYKCWPQCFIDS